MNSRNYKYALLLVAAVSITATGAMSQAYAQSVDDGMDGYVKGTSGIYTGNPKVLKEICPGVFGTIKPIGICMIGSK